MGPLDVELDGVNGLGPAKIEKLKAAGIRDAKVLAEVDLRTFLEIEGVSRDNLKALKQRARQACRKAGIEYEKAPYRSTASPRPAKAPRPAGKPAAKPPKKRGLLARLRRKA